MFYSTSTLSSCLSVSRYDLYVPTALHVTFTILLLLLLLLHSDICFDVSVMISAFRLPRTTCFTMLHSHLMLP